MKKYTTPRPTFVTYVQWDGSNIAEFEALTGEDWPWLWWNQATFVNNEGNLEIWRGDYLADTIPNGWWSAGPGNTFEDVVDTSNEAVITGNPPFNYMIT
jgi:hypothetical protein